MPPRTPVGRCSRRADGVRVAAGVGLHPCRHRQDGLALLCTRQRSSSLPSRPPHGEVGIQSGFGRRFDDLGRRPRLAASPQFDEQALLVLTTQRFRPISCERVHRVSVVVRFLQGLIAPWELRRLMRRLPTTPRLWVRTKSGIRPEADADYLARLRERAREKKASRSAAVNARRFTATRRSRV